MTDNSSTTFTLNNHNHSNVPKNVVTATVHPTVTTIHELTFYECTSLTSINMSDQVTTIGYNAFVGCTALTSIRIPDQVTTIENCAFSGCTALVSINMSDQVTTIGPYAFYGCTALTSINISNQVTTIAYEAFSGCTALVSIRIPDQVTTIENCAFNGCTALKSINISDQVTTIRDYAFKDCTALVSISIPNQVTTIGDTAFSGCTALNQRQTNGNNYHRNTHTWLRQRFNDLPLHQACFNYNTNTNNRITNTNNLHDLIQQHSGTSMFTSTDAMLMTPLHVLCCNPTATLEMIQMLKAAQPDAASMRNVMNKTPLMMLLESKSKNYSAFHDEGGQLLPLVGLLEQGLDFDALEMIKSASVNDVVFVSELQHNDEASGLLPFMYGASLGNCRLDVVYELAMEISPSVLTRTHYECNDSTVKKEGTKRKRNTNTNGE
jgi:hypothetical protein